MNYLITGGSGFIGAALTASLLGDGHHVTWHSRDIAKTRRSAPASVVVIDDYKAAQDVDIVINLAAKTSPTDAGAMFASRRSANPASAPRSAWSRGWRRCRASLKC